MRARASTADGDVTMPPFIAIALIPTTVMATATQPATNGIAASVITRLCEIDNAGIECRAAVASAVVVMVAAPRVAYTASRLYDTLK